MTASEHAFPGKPGAPLVGVGKQQIRLTKLDKQFWPHEGFRNQDLLSYYLRVAPHLLPHLKDRPMVLLRHPYGAADAGFFMKHAPDTRPEWVATCRIRHKGRHTDFVLVQDLATLLWVVNLGCIDLNPWYSRCDAPEHPDHLMLDLDPGADTPFAAVRDAALVVHDALASLGAPARSR